MTSDRKRLTPIGMFRVFCAIAFVWGVLRSFDGHTFDVLWWLRMAVAGAVGWWYSVVSAELRRLGRIDAALDRLGADLSDKDGPLR